MNLQRKSIFNQRRDIMETQSVSETITEMREKVIDNRDCLFNLQLLPKAVNNKKSDSWPKEWAKEFGNTTEYNALEKENLLDGLKDTPVKEVWSWWLNRAEKMKQMLCEIIDVEDVEDFPE